MNEPWLIPARWPETRLVEIKFLNKQNCNLNSYPCAVVFSETLTGQGWFFLAIFFATDNTLGATTVNSRFNRLSAGTPNQVLWGLEKKLDFVPLTCAQHWMYTYVMVSVAGPSLHNEIGLSGRMAMGSRSSQAHAGYVSQHSGKDVGSVHRILARICL